MIIQKKNIIFIHIPKNAGTSIEKVFNYEEKIVEFCKKRVHLLNSKACLFCCFNNLSKWVHFPTKKILKYHHNLKEVEEFINTNTIIFAVVRHPQDRLVSLYNFLNYNLSFEHFIYEIMPRKNYFQRCNSSFKSIYGRLFMSQKDYIDSIFINQVQILKFENLSHDFNHFVNKNNLAVAPLRHLNKTNHSKWINYYTKEMAELVYHYYKSDFDTFNYKIDYSDNNLPEVRQAKN